MTAGVVHDAGNAKMKRFCMHRKNPQAAGCTILTLILKLFARYSAYLPRFAVVIVLAASSCPRY